MLVSALATAGRPAGFVDKWLSRYPRQGGVVLVDKPVHFGGDAEGERKYVQQMRTDPRFEAKVEKQLSEMLQQGLRTAALEIGAGHGIMSRPLLATRLYPVTVITDSSAAFLEIQREMLPPRLQGGARFACLSSLAKVPSSTFGLVALRYVLHHILDWKGFIRDAARVLQPGGLLLMCEPMSDGFMLQRALASACLMRMTPASHSAEVINDFRRFVTAMTGYLRTDFDKSHMEDKNFFSQHQLFHACASAGLRTKMMPNVNIGPGPASFSQEFKHNFVTNFQMPPGTLAEFKRCFHDTNVTDYDAFDRYDGTGPVVQAIILATKDPLPLPTAPLAAPSNFAAGVAALCLCACGVMCAAYAERRRRLGH
jgi:ubiquinone/menaquinone biosynthesis C-methylase UbiE